MDLPSASAWPPSHVHPRSTRILGWALSPSADAERICFGGVDRKDFFNGQRMLPVIAKVILILEPLCRPKTKIRKPDFVGIIGESDTAFIGNAVLLATNRELVEMAVVPAHGRLHDFMKEADRAVVRNQNTSPYRRLDPVQNDL